MAVNLAVNWHESQEDESPSSRAPLNPGGHPAGARGFYAGLRRGHALVSDDAPRDQTHQQEISMTSSQERDVNQLIQMSPPDRPISSSPPDSLLPTASSKDHPYWPPPSLQDLAGISGVGALILSAVPISQRLQLAALCKSLRAAVDESLETVHQVSARDLAPCGKPLVPGCDKAARYGDTKPAEWDNKAARYGKAADMPGGGPAMDKEVSDAAQYDRAARNDRITAPVVASASVAPAVDGSVVPPVGGVDAGGLGVGGVDAGWVPDVVAALLWLVDRCPHLRVLTLSRDLPPAGAEGMFLCKREREMPASPQEADNPLYPYNTGGMAYAWAPRQVRMPPCARDLAATLWHCTVIDPVLRHLADKIGAQLDTLDVSGCGRVMDAGVRAVARACPRLRHLALACCRQVSDASVLAVAEGCRDLAYLDLRGCRVTDASISSIGRKCGQLQHLAVTEDGSRMANRVTDAGVTVLAQHARRLTSLDLSCCARVSDTGVGQLAANCPQLECLCLCDCQLVTDAGIWFLAERCAQLEYLDVAGCDVTDGSIRAVAARCRGLRYMGLASCPVGDGALRAVAAYCPRLISLDVNFCNYITGDGIRAVAMARGQGLRYLDMGRCHHVTAGSISVVARFCPRLESLDVGECRGVTDASVGLLARHCRGLTRVSLMGCAGVTDGGVTALAAHCKQLEWLSVQHCFQLTAASLRALACGCPQLRFLDVSGCSQLSHCGQGVTEGELSSGCRVLGLTFHEKYD
eukprot:jgi/Mesvir1/5197/Mv15329-RA.1